MLYADNKEKPQKIPSGRINTPEDAVGPSFAPPELFKDDEEMEDEMEGSIDPSELEEEKKKKKGT